MSKHIIPPASPASALSTHARRERLVFGTIRVVVAVVVGLFGICQAVDSHFRGTPWAQLHCRDGDTVELCRVVRTGPVAAPVVGAEAALKWARVETRESKSADGKKASTWQVVVVSFVGAPDLELEPSDPATVAAELQAMKDVMLRMRSHHAVVGALVALIAFAIASFRQHVSKEDGTVSFETTCCGVSFHSVDIAVASLRGLRFEPGEPGEDGRSARTVAVTASGGKSLWLSEGEAREAARFLGVGFERLSAPVGT
ncbi:MAG: hypothetical protein Q8O67_22080 [Deltaproteobacteria bacterium]|nr:hypothetical protein [Deltaproteobacteria bacterium]